MKKLFLLLALSSLSCMTQAMPEAFASATPSMAMVDQTDQPAEVEVIELSDAVRLPIEFVVCTDVLHVRNNAFVAEGNVIGWLVRGDVVMVQEFNNGWGRLAGTNEHRVRYVKLEFLCRS